VTANLPLFIESRPVPARIGIVYNPLSQMVGGAQRRSDWPQAMQNSLIGYYRIFADHNIPVDFIHRNELESTDLSQYKLLVVPYPLMFTETAAAGLRKFVAAGGYAVGEARLAWNDERGFASPIIPGMSLHEVFGVREKNVWMKSPALMTVTDSSHALTRGLQGNVRGELYVSTMTPLSSNARVLASFQGEPAIIESSYGKGRTLFVGTFMGWGNHPEQTPANSALIRRLADWAGIEKPVATSLDGSLALPVIARLQQREKGWLLFLINHGSEAQQPDVSVQLPDGRYGMRELISGRRMDAVARDGVLRFTTSVGGQNVEVWSIE
jgi:beta-galactosidase